MLEQQLDRSGGRGRRLSIRLAWHSSGTYDHGDGGVQRRGDEVLGRGGRSRKRRTQHRPRVFGARQEEVPPNQLLGPLDTGELRGIGAHGRAGHIVPFTAGRVDHVDGSYWTANDMSYGRLPAAEKYTCPHLDDSNVGESLDADGTVKGWEGLCTHVRDEVFYRMGFDDREIVALLCGGHVYGRCHPTASGYAGPWVENPTEFSNEYATDMLEDEWTLVSHGNIWLDDQGSAELRPAPGNRKFVNQKDGVESDDSNQMMLLSDMILAWDTEFRTHLEMYAEDEELLKHDFGVAFKKLTELGCNF